MSDTEQKIRRLVDRALSGDEDAQATVEALSPEFAGRIRRAALKLADIRTDVTAAASAAASPEEASRIIRVAVESAMLEITEGAGHA